jgi:hypothetical protein
MQPQRANPKTLSEFFLQLALLVSIARRGGLPLLAPARLHWFRSRCVHELPLRRGSG